MIFPLDTRHSTLVLYKQNPGSQQEKDKPKGYEDMNNQINTTSPTTVELLGVNGRGARLLRSSILIFALVILAAASCTMECKPQEVADRFMDLYYAHPNMAGAVKLCSGAAKTKLEGQLQAIKGVAPDSSSAEPQ